jgi:glycosyltransferase involved in cell wall biosynthesis
VQQHPDCQVLIVGGDDVSYGSKPKDAANWREKLQGEVSLDPARVHFLGRIRQLPQGTAYLRRPRLSDLPVRAFLVDAVASGCLVIGSATPPVQEVIRHNENGLLVDFFDTNASSQHHYPHPATS